MVNVFWVTWRLFTKASFYDIQGMPILEHLERPLLKLLVTKQENSHVKYHRHRGIAFVACRLKYWKIVDDFSSCHLQQDMGNKRPLEEREDTIDYRSTEKRN